MDYPSDESIKLFGRKYTDGDPAQGIDASLDPAQQNNMVNDELINVITSAGLTADENILTQLKDALDILYMTENDRKIFAIRNQIKIANPKNFRLNDVAWGEPGSTNGKTVAVGVADGTDAYILANGEIGKFGYLNKFTEIPNPKNVNLNAIAAGGGGLGDYVAVGDADGTDAYIVAGEGDGFLEVANPKNVALNGIAHGHTGGATTSYVMVGDPDGLDAYILTAEISPPHTLTERLNPKHVKLNDVAFGNETFVAVGESDGTQPYIITSTDGGVTWIQRTAIFSDLALQTIAFGQGVFLAFGDHHTPFISSDNGITWQEKSGYPSAVPAVSKIRYHNGIWIALIDYDFVGARIINFVPDILSGVAWQRMYQDDDAGLTGVVWDNEMRRFIFVGDADGTQANIYASAML